MPVESLSDEIVSGIENVFLRLVREKTDVFMKAINEGMQLLQERESLNLASNATAEKVNFKRNGIVWGDPNAVLQIYAMIDPMCTHCHEFIRTAIVTLDTFSDVAFTFVVAPILGANSEAVSKVMLASMLQGPNKTKALMGKFIDKVNDLTREKLIDLIVSSDIDEVQFKIDEESAAVHVKLEENTALFEKLKIPGVPTILVQNKDGSLFSIPATKPHTYWKLMNQLRMNESISDFDVITNGLEDNIAAIFSDGTTISLQEVKDLFCQLPPELDRAPFSEFYVRLLNSLVDSKLLLDSAKNEQLDEDAVVASVINANELLLQKAYLDKKIDEMVTDEILRLKYDEQVRGCPKDEMESEVSHILFDSQENAEITLRELQLFDQNTEEEFNKKVVLQSIDSSTKENKGSIGWVRKADVKNETLFKAEKGTLVPQVLKVFDQGYSVFYIKDKRLVQPPVFETIKSNIKQAVTPQYAFQIVDKMRRDSGLKLTGLDGQPMSLPNLPPMLDANMEEQKSTAKEYFASVDEKALDNSMIVGVFANGYKITLGQVRDSLGIIPDQLKNAPFHQLFEPLVLRVADTKLLIDAAKKAGLEKSPDLLKKQEEVQKGIYQRAYLDKQFAQIITPEMLKEAYQEFLKIFPKDDMEIRIKHIMVATKEEATALLKEIKSGKAKFNDELVKAKSIDPQTKETGGDLGYIPKKQLPTDLGDVLFKAVEATFIPEPIALGENGFSVIRVEDKRAIQPPSIEEIRLQLMETISKREASKIVLKLREEAKVILYDMDGNIMSI